MSVLAANLVYQADLPTLSRHLWRAFSRSSRDLLTWTTASRLQLPRWDAMSLSCASQLYGEKVSAISLLRRSRSLPSRRLFTENGSTKKSACAETTDPSPLASHPCQCEPAGCWQDPFQHLAHRSDIRKSDRAPGCVRAASDSERETNLNL
jgi:hypothetical protein